jgi:hypothetical protein
MKEIIAELRKIAADAKTVFGSLSSEQINWKPNAKSWSIGQCFEHLIVTNRLYFPNIQKALDGQHRNNLFSQIPFVADFIGALMKNSLKPEQRRKMKTFRIFEPAASNISGAIIDDFAENQLELIGMLEAVKEFDLRKIKISEPLSVAMNIRLNDTFEILALHEQRHFQQAERVMREAGFPHRN